MSETQAPSLLERLNNPPIYDGDNYGVGGSPEYLESQRSREDALWGEIEPASPPFFADEQDEDSTEDRSEKLGRKRELYIAAGKLATAGSYVNFELLPGRVGLIDRARIKRSKKAESHLNRVKADTLTSARLSDKSKRWKKQHESNLKRLRKAEYKFNNTVIGRYGTENENDIPEPAERPNNQEERSEEYSSDDESRDNRLNRLKRGVKYSQVAYYGVRAAISESRANRYADSADELDRSAELIDLSNDPSDEALDARDEYDIRAEKLNNKAANHRTRAKKFNNRQNKKFQEYQDLYDSSEELDNEYASEYLNSSEDGFFTRGQSVTVERTSGEIEKDWLFLGIDSETGLAEVVKIDLATGERLSKKYPLEELRRINSLDLGESDTDNPQGSVENDEPIEDNEADSSPYKKGDKIVYTALDGSLDDSWVFHSIDPETGKIVLEKSAQDGSKSTYLKQIDPNRITSSADEASGTEGQDAPKSNTQESSKKDEIKPDKKTQEAIDSLSRAFVKIDTLEALSRQIGRSINQARRSERSKNNDEPLSKEVAASIAHKVKTEIIEKFIADNGLTDDYEGDLRKVLSHINRLHMDQRRQSK